MERAPDELREGSNDNELPDDRAPGSVRTPACPANMQPEERPLHDTEPKNGHRSRSALYRHSAWPNQERFAATDSLKRRRLTAEWWPDLRDLIRTRKFGLAVPRGAIHAVGKMKDPPEEAVDELIAAAQPGYQGQIPQYFRDAVASLVAIAPNDPRLPDVLGHGLTIDNYQLQKSAVEGLIRIDSAESRQILQTIRERLPRNYTEQLVIALLDRVDTYLTNQGVVPSHAGRRRNASDS